jgi:capsular polysaccharide biosynthesis protein
MEEINLKELFDYIKERILIIAIIVLGVLILGSVYSLFIKTPLYKSTSTLVLVSDEGTSASNTYTTQDVTLNNQLVSTYSKIVTSHRVIDTVISNLNLDYSYSEVVKEVAVTTETGTQIIKVSVSDPDKALAASIANEIVKVFGEEIKSIYKLQNVSVVDEAEEAKYPANVNYIKEAIIYILVGTVLAFGIVFVIYYFDTSIKGPEEIENKLGLPVIGVIPKVKDKK